MFCGLVGTSGICIKKKSLVSFFCQYLKSKKLINNEILWWPWQDGAQTAHTFCWVWIQCAISTRRKMHWSWMEECLQERRLDCTCRGWDVEVALALEHPVVSKAFWMGSLSAGWGYWEQGGGCPLPSLNPSSLSFALALGASSACRI